MEQTYHDLNGDIVSQSDLKIGEASDLAEAARSESLPFVSLVECRRHDSGESITLNVAPEVPQHPVHDIQMTERIAVVFPLEHYGDPSVLALRENFPDTPHQNIIAPGQPRDLCLYEEPYSERRSQWTAARFIRRLQVWLGQASRGELHAADQPLEQLFLGSPHRIILPSALFESEAGDIPSNLLVTLLGETQGSHTYEARSADSTSESDASFVGYIHEAAPRPHGIIEIQPQNLAELNSYFEGENLVSSIRTWLQEQQAEENLSLNSRLLIVLRIPKQRSENEEPEAIDVWAFATEATIATVGESIGAWEMYDGQPGRLIGSNPEEDGEDVQVTICNPTSALTKNRAAEISGLSAANDSLQVIVGVGTLGSQLLMNLIRQGQGTWTVIDKDHLMPHNVPRHFLISPFVGLPKAKVMADLINNVFEEHTASSVVADVLKDETDEIQEAFQDGDVILDASASVSVARHLTLDVSSEARRVSLFLSPHGRDLVLLAEDPRRETRLDQVEMEYYRAVAAPGSPFPDHLMDSGERLRYGRSCRDLSSTLSQEDAALHAANGTRAYRRITDSVETPVAQMWRVDERGNVRHFDLEVSAHIEVIIGDWTVSISEHTFSQIEDLRASRLPHETGGVLIGAFDTARKRIYVTHHIPSPPDSEEWPTSYRRGIDGLLDQLQEIDRRTAGQMEYVGEWHSHPDSARTIASSDDENLFQWLVEHRKRDGLPAVMAIVGDQSRLRWYVQALSQHAEISNQST